MGSVFYHEDGWIAEVLVLEDLGDRDREAYRLEVVRTLRAPPSPRFRPAPDGHQFLCDQARNPPEQIFHLTREEIPSAA